MRVGALPHETKGPAATQGLSNFCACRRGMLQSITSGERINGAVRRPAAVVTASLLPTARREGDCPLN